MNTAPMHGVRVLNLGGIWAGRVASMLLADQGADVIEISRPGRIPSPEDELLARGKRLLTLDLGTPAGSAAARALACDADIVIDNLGPGRARCFGLDYAALAEDYPTVVYISIPGFASGSPMAGEPAWEGTISASVGVYTDLHATGSLLGGPPIFTAVPMASAYGGVLAAISASLAYLHRLQSGAGQLVEVPLAEALMAAMGLLAMRIEGQPARFDLPAIDKAMTDVAFPILRDLGEHLTGEHRAAIGGYLKRFAKPLLAHYRCGDGRMVFLNALDHGHQSRAALETLGVLDQLLAEGMVAGSPYEEGGAGNNIANAATLSPHWTKRLQELLAQRFLTRGADEWSAVLQQAGVPCARVRTAQEWLADPVARASGCVAQLDGGWQAGRFISIAGAGCASPALAPPAAAVDAAWAPRADCATPTTQATQAAQAAQAGPAMSDAASSRKARGILDGVRVLDLSNVIAGPVAARTLAEFGAEVIRIDAPSPQAGPRMTMWFGIDVNQGKRAAIIDLKTAAGRDVLAGLVRNADVVIHNFLDRSCPGIGITYEELHAINPDIVCCQISAWGGPEGGAHKDYPAFDPVLQAATGITARYGDPGAPVMHGVASCVDYMSGYCGALGVAQALVARARRQGGALVRTSLAMGAQLVQFPFMCDAAQAAPVHEVSGQQAKGNAASHSLYRMQDGWVFLACRLEQVPAIAAAAGAAAPTQAALADALAQLPFRRLQAITRDFPSASAVRTMRLQDVRAASASATDSQSPVALEGRSTPMAQFDHPCGCRTTLPLPGWIRMRATPLRRLAPAPIPGAHTAEVLAGLRLDAAHVARLYADGVALDGWPMLQRYFPL
jgi:crotonobetainyl-CoA:carnitine CoA-transferase CaiB-like acyl-CoA transferase